MGQAQTGTGKTAAFAIPILEMLQPQRRGGPPQALVLVPTRELAVQVRDECEKLALGRNVSIVAVYGGKPIRKQIEQVNHGASFIVGTPGRVLDLMSRGALMLERAAGRRAWTRPIACSTSASGPTSRRSSAAARNRGRRCLLSATLAPPVKRLAERYMREPEVLDFSPKNLAVETIEQFYFTVDPERKFDLLVKLLEREDPKQAIIFCRTKRGTDKIYTRLSRRFERRRHDPRRLAAIGPRPRDEGLSRGQGPLAGGHRRGRPRHRRHRHLAHHQLRHPGRSATTTCTASAAPAAWAARAWPTRSFRPRKAAS